MLLIFLLAGTSQLVLLRWLRASSSAIQREGSVALMLVGVGLIYFTLDAGGFQRMFVPP